MRTVISTEIYSHHELTFATIRKSVGLKGLKVPSLCMFFHNPLTDICSMYVYGLSELIMKRIA